MPEVNVVAEAGRPTGSSHARRLRRAGKVPAVLYGHGVDPTPLTLDGRELRHALAGEAGVNALLSLDVNGTRHLAMARQIQRHPVRGSLDHVDFVIVRRDEVVTAEVPIHLVGEATEVHLGDGRVDQQLFALAVLARPGDIPVAIEVDVSALVIGESIRVGDLSLAAGVNTDVDPDTPVAVGQGPQAVELPEEAAAAEGEAEGEGAEAAGGPEAAGAGGAGGAERSPGTGEG